MDIKTLRAVFTGGSYCKTRPLTRQDYGIKLQFVHADLDQYGTYQVHFSNVKDNNGTAKTQIADADGVVIPDEYLITGKTVYAWAFVQSESAGRTRCMVEIPVAEKPTVTPEEPTPQQRSAIDEAIDALNTGVTRAETAADDAEAAAANIQQTVDDALQAAKDSGEFDGTDGVNGVTFTPDVDAAGNISWTNDGDLPNPQTRNIKGPKGDKLKYADLTAADKADLIQGPIAEAQTEAVEAVEQKGEETLAELQEYADLPEDVADLKSAINDKAPIIINSASGAIASFADGADNMPVKQLTVNVEPIQDLHGYDSPWPAGGGKNKFYRDTDKTNTLNGVTGTFDAETQTISVVGTNTASSAYVLLNLECTGDIPREVALARTLFNATSDIYINLVYRKDGVWIGVNNGGSIPAEIDSTVNLQIGVYGSATSINATNIKAQIELGSTAPTAWTPYSNICPISGHDSVSVTRTGKNLANMFNDGKVPSISNGQLVTANGFRSDFIPFKANAAFTFHVTDAVVYTIFYDKDKNFLTAFSNGTGTISNTTPANTAYVMLRKDNNTAPTNAQLEYGTITAYKPYQGNTYTIQLGDTVYGGTLDVTQGKMVVDRAMVDLGSLVWNYNATYAFFTSNSISTRKIGVLNVWSDLFKTMAGSWSGTPVQNALWGNGSNTTLYVQTPPLDKVNDFMALVDGHQLMYELATPIEITLTPTQIDTLLGTNNVWSDAGDVNVDYRADTKLYIDNIHQPTEDDMTADAQIASGKYFLIGGALYKATTVIPAGDTIIPGTNCIKTNLAEALNALNA